MPTNLRYCSTCSGEREFEQPPCPDDHGPDCPEWLCVECGFAVVIEFDLIDEEPATLRWAA